MPLRPWSFHSLCQTEKAGAEQNGADTSPRQPTPLLGVEQDDPPGDYASLPSDIRQLANGSEAWRSNKQLERAKTRGLGAVYKRRVKDDVYVKDGEAWRRGEVVEINLLTRTVSVRIEANGRCVEVRDDSDNVRCWSTSSLVACGDVHIERPQSSKRQRVARYQLGSGKAVVSNLACTACAGGDSGELLLSCDFCSLVYHIDCVKPPLDAPPPLPWACPECVEEQTELELNVQMPQADDIVPAEPGVCYQCQGHEGTMLHCSCGLSWHQHCLKLPPTSMASWLCPCCVPPLISIQPPIQSRIFGCTKCRFNKKGCSRCQAKSARVGQPPLQPYGQTAQDKDESQKHLKPPVSFRHTPPRDGVVRARQPTLQKAVKRKAAADEQQSKQTAKRQRKAVHAAGLGYMVSTLPFQEQLQMAMQQSQREEEKKRKVAHKEHRAGNAQLNGHKGKRSVHVLGQFEIVESTGTI